MTKPDERRVFSVSELSEALRGLLEDSLPGIWVQGEVSNFRNPSGHWYFTLKDGSAQVRCAMFKGRNLYFRPQPKDGDAVLLRGTVSFYAVRGDLQIVAEHLEPAGEGALLRAFEELKRKLAAEGLFDEHLKRPLPPVPRAIGIISSPTGAALHDILTTLRRRFPLGTAYVYPVPVQGSAAPAAIVRALAELPRRAPVDVIVLARGGGSLEDLWAFNDESIAHAIRGSRVPVVTGIGHETDFTIADFAADLRAPTPTGAAELVSPDAAEWRARLARLEECLVRCQRAHRAEAGDALMRLRRRLDLTHPGRRLQHFHQRLDELGERLGRQLVSRLKQLAERVDSRASLLNSLGPRAVLERGYAIVRKASGEVVRDSRTLSAGETLETMLAKGSVRSVVKDSVP